MNGDRSKPQNTLMRWVDYFYDGLYKTTKKGKHRVPSPCGKGKDYNKRWIRRERKYGIIAHHQ